MSREQEILEQITKLNDEFNNLGCGINSGKKCDNCSKQKICDAITELGTAIVDFKYSQINL